MPDEFVLSDEEALNDPGFKLIKIPGSLWKYLLQCIYVGGSDRGSAKIEFNLIPYMQKTLFLFLSLSSIAAHSQKVTISGTVSDTTKGKSQIYVIVNDTLRKFFPGSKEPDRKKYNMLTKDTSLVLFVKSNGLFQITANKSDSIFFQ